MSENRPFHHGLGWLTIFVIMLAFAGAVIFFGRNEFALVSQTITPTDTALLHQSRQYVVSYSNGVFSPTNLKIKVGDSVAFRNDSSDPIMIVQQQFGESPEIAQQAMFAYLFSLSGTYEYHIKDRDGERGTINVNQ